MGSFGLSSVVVGDPWAAFGAFGRPLGLHLSPLGFHWGASGASLGSICRLWGSIGAPLGVIGDHFGGHFAIISVHFVFIWLLKVIEGHWESLWFFLRKNAP